MSDPFSTAYLAAAAANVTSNILHVLGSRWSQALAATPRQQALQRCYQAALAALLPADDLHRALHQPLLEAFINAPAVVAELARLVRGRPPDLEILVDCFAEITPGHTLPPLHHLWGQVLK